MFSKVAQEKKNMSLWRVNAIQCHNKCEPPGRSLTSLSNINETNYHLKQYGNANETFKVTLWSWMT